MVGSLVNRVTVALQDRSRIIDRTTGPDQTNRPKRGPSPFAGTNLRSVPAQPTFGRCPVLRTNGDCPLFPSSRAVVPSHGSASPPHSWTLFSESGISGVNGVLKIPLGESHPLLLAARDVRSPPAAETIVVSGQWPVASGQWPVVSDEGTRDERQRVRFPLNPHPLSLIPLLTTDHWPLATHHSSCRESLRGRQSLPGIVRNSVAGVILGPFALTHILTRSDTRFVGIPRRVGSGA